MSNKPLTDVATIRLRVDEQGCFYGSTTTADGKRALVTGPWKTRDGLLHGVARWLSEQPGEKL